MLKLPRLYVQAVCFVRSASTVFGQKGRYELFIATRFLMLSLSYWSGNHVLLCVGQSNTCGHNAKL